MSRFGKATPDLRVRLDRPLADAVANYAERVGATSGAEAVRSLLRLALGMATADRHGGYASGYAEGRLAGYRDIRRAVDATLADLSDPR